MVTAVDTLISLPSCSIVNSVPSLRVYVVAARWTSTWSRCPLIISAPPMRGIFLCWDDSAVLSSRAVNYRALERPNPEAVLRNCLEFDAASVWITSTTSRRPAVRMRRSSEGLAQAINTRQQGPARGRFARHQATLSTPRLPWSWPAADRKLDQYVFAIGNPFARLLLVRCARS